jgi:hypothetical protein
MQQQQPACWISPQLASCVTQQQARVVPLLLLRPVLPTERRLLRLLVASVALACPRSNPQWRLR